MMFLPFEYQGVFELECASGLLDEPVEMSLQRCACITSYHVEYFSSLIY